MTPPMRVHIITMLKLFIIYQSIDYLVEAVFGVLVKMWGVNVEAKFRDD